MPSFTHQFGGTVVFERTGTYVERYFWERKMYEEGLGPHNAIWDDGEWISWHSINSHLERLELEARYPNANVDLIPLLQTLLETASQYNFATEKHLSIYGDIGEIFGAVMYGIELHKDNAMGSDGRRGDDFVEVKTITPFKNAQTVDVRLDRHFSQLLLVKINDDFEVSGRLIKRSDLPRTRGKVLRLSWEAFLEGERQRFPA